LAWTLEYDAKARRQLRKLAPAAGQRILEGLEHLATLDNPRLKGKAMAGRYAGHWRYRFGDYRVIARIEDRRLVILVVAVGDRREVYR
jgi:mRNA interferase RelE/StbE